MLDLNVNISINKDKFDNLTSQKAFDSNDDKFSKVLDEVNKSFEAAKEAIEKAEKNSKEKKDKNDKTASNKNKNEFLEDSNSKTEKDEENKNRELTMEQLLLNYNAQLSTKEQRNQFKDVRNLKNTADNLLQQREQTLEMTAKMLDKLKMPNNGMHSIKMQAQAANSQQNAFLAQQQQGIAVFQDAVLNLRNTLNSKFGNTQPLLADALADLKAEVTSVKVEAGQSEAKGFDFNSSSFSNLDSHVTKMNLNKGVDFVKVMGQKVAQEQQILNQVKEGTQNLAKGSSQVNIVLRPESLGRINVHINSANGAVTAQFTAQSQQAADALSKNIDALKQSLAEQGVKVSEVSVKVQETSQSDTFADARSFDEGKLNSSKENNSNRNSYKSNASSDDTENKQYIGNGEMEETEEEIVASTASTTNNNLGIYNNMGRKV